MIWGIPSALLLLLGAVPLILFLHSLRPRGVSVKTTSLFLWERVLEKQPVGKKIGWLFRKNILLILQLAVALVLIAALADPSLLDLSGRRGDIVAVIDLSASMKAKRGAGSRFDAAQSELLSLVNGMGAGEKMMVIGAGPALAVLSSWTEDKKRLADLVRSLKPADAPAQVHEAVLFAHSFLRPEKTGRIVVLSDGAFDGAEELSWQASHLRLILVGEDGENIGITGFEARRLPNSADRYELMVQVKNFTGRPARPRLSLFFDGTERLREDLDLEAGQSRVVIHSIEAPLPARAEARLDTGDDFSTDDRAYLALSGSSPRSILYAGPGNPFLQRLFRSIPDLRVTEVTEWSPELHARAAGEYDVVVVDGLRLPPVQEGNFIFLNAAPAGPSVEVRGRIDRPRLHPAPAAHPLTDRARLDDLYIREALRISLKGNATVLAVAKEGPLVFALERKKLRALVLAFDLSASDLPFKVAFPVLFDNALRWLRPAGAEFPAAQVRAGSAYPIHLSPSDERIEIEVPSGERRVLKVDAHPFVFDGALEAGFYAYRSESGQGRFAANLLSEGESEIAPRIRTEDLTSPRPDGGAKKEALSLWPSLIAIALFLLGLELCWAWHTLQASWAPALCRFLALGAALGAVANPTIFKAASGVDVVLGVDYSESVGQSAKAEALRVLDESRRSNIAESRLGLLFFGRRPLWEFFPESGWSGSDFAPEVEREESDIEAALRAALAQIPDERQGRILLVSDGNETRGDASRLLPVLRGRNVPVWVLPVGDSQGRNEVYVRDLVLPQEVAAGEGFEVKAAIESLAPASARVKLARDGVVVREEEHRLEAGTRWLRFPQSLTAEGGHSFSLLLEAGAQDTFAENNLLEGAVMVRGAPRVLYLSTGGAGRHGAKALASQGYTVVESPPEKAALSLAELAAYDLVVLDDVPAYRLMQAQMESIEKYVRDVGGGLVAIGGPHSYGAGGYIKTPLERALPVEMRPPARLELPHVALLFLIDKSGSMGGGAPGATKLDLAKAAAISAADIMSPSDQTAILAFDAEWSWILPFRQVGQGEWLSDKLAQVQSDGGTDLYKAMTEARRALAAARASIRHLVILSDGLTERGEFDALVLRMAQEGITVSTVAIGEDADVDFMARISRGGKGRRYFTFNIETIPQIFTAEALLASRDLVIEKFVYPSALSGRGPLRGFAREPFPPLHGYVLTYPKPHSERLMNVEHDPLLVTWRYGLGNVIAFTSDLSGRWGKDWVQWENFSRWVAQVARYAMRRSRDPGVRVQLENEGGEAKAVVDIVAPGGGFANHLVLKGSVAAPGPTQTTVFRQTAPGRYETRLPARERGVHLLTVYQEENGLASALATVPLASPYPREYRDLTANVALLGRLAEETGGEVLDRAGFEDGLKRLLTPGPGQARSVREAWWPLSGLGLALFLIDLVLRALPALPSVAPWKKSVRA